jgi:hypothetical protein
VEFRPYRTAYPIFGQAAIIFCQSSLLRAAKTRKRPFFKAKKKKVNIGFTLHIFPIFAEKKT